VLTWFIHRPLFHTLTKEISIVRGLSVTASILRSAADPTPLFLRGPTRLVPHRPHRGHRCGPGRLRCELKSSPISFFRFRTMVVIHPTIRSERCWRRWALIFDIRKAMFEKSRDICCTEASLRWPPTCLVINLTPRFVP